MTEVEERLRRELLLVADEVPVPVLPTGADYRATSRRPAHARTAFVASMAAAAVIATLVAVVTVVGRGPGGVPTSGATSLSWPARGDLASDQALLAHAARTWDAAPLPTRELPHHNVRLLYATHTEAGDTVVLRGTDALGHQRIAWLNTDPTSKTPFRNRLHLLGDVLAPKGSQSHLLALWGPRPTTRPTDDSLLVALAPPGTRTLQWHDLDQPWQTVEVVDGAAATVVATHNPLVNVRIRAGRSGGGVSPLVLLQEFGGPTAVEHDLDPEEQPPSSANCSGQLCSDSASATLRPFDKSGGWSDLGQARPVSGSEWDEFGAEATLMAESRHLDESHSWQSTFSALLPDDTGLYLLRFTSGDSQPRLLLYVDRPEWYGGRAGADVNATDGSHAIATLVPVDNRTHLVAVAADDIRIEWSVDDTTWQKAPVERHVTDVAIPTGTPTPAWWRAIDASGAIVAGGALH